MTFSLLWLPGILRAAGLIVNEVPGWQNRGHGDEGKVLGVLCHHTCGPLHGDLPDLNVLIDGRPDLGGPLCNLGLGRSGQYWMIAAGKGWHAGGGNWQGITDGNAHLIGIEAENIGTSDRQGNPLEPWPAVQMDAYKRGCAAILRHIGALPIMCAGHKEYALPHGRKDDPNFDMVAFRRDVAALMALPAGVSPVAVPSPVATPSSVAPPVVSSPPPASPPHTPLPNTPTKPAQTDVDTAFDAAASDTPGSTG
jgi:hypothetical protein